MLPCPPPGDLLDPGIKPASLTVPALTGMLFTTSATQEDQPRRQICKVLEIFETSIVAASGEGKPLILVDFIHFVDSFFTHSFSTSLLNTLLKCLGSLREKHIVLSQENMQMNRHHN